MDLSGLEKMRVECALYVADNAALTDVGALSAASSLAYRVEIENNPALATCAAQSAADALPTTTAECRVSRRVRAEPRVISIKGNDDSAVCD